MFFITIQYTIRLFVRCGEGEGGSEESDSGDYWWRGGAISVCWYGYWWRPGGRMIPCGCRKEKTIGGAVNRTAGIEGGAG